MLYSSLFSLWMTAICWRSVWEDVKQIYSCSKKHCLREQRGQKGSGWIYLVLLGFSETLSHVVYFTYKYLHKWCTLSTDMYTLLLLLLVFSRHFSVYVMILFSSVNFKYFSLIILIWLLLSILIWLSVFN